MAFHTFGPGLALDRVTMAPLPAVVASLEDAETGEPVQAFSMDDESLPVLVATNRYGYFGQFKVPDVVRRLRLTFAGLTLEHTAWELIPAALEQAIAARNEAELAKIAAQQAAALVAAPADTVVKTLVQGTGTLTRQALDALYMGKGTLGLATPTADGLMPKADKAKLDGLGGLATSTADGLMPKADKAKLDGATAAVTPNQVVRRDSGSRFQVPAPSSNPLDVINRGYVDPLTIGTLMPAGAHDLNDYAAAGTYNQPLNAGAVAGTNYPMPYAGRMTVATQGSITWQTYHGYQAQNRFFWRSKYNSVWSAWAEGASTVTVESVARRAVSVYNVRDYGAKGDGNTDDTAAVQAAMDAVKAAGGGRIFFPFGDYYIRDIVWLCSNVEIYGDRATIRKKYTTDPSYVVFAGSSGSKQGYGAGANNIYIHDLTFRGKFGTGGRGLCVLALNHSDDVLAERLDIAEASGGGHRFDLGGCRRVLIRNSVFQGFDSSLGSTYNEDIQADYSTRRSGSFIEPDVSCYDGLPSQDVVVEGNHWLPWTTGGTTYPAANPFGTHGTIQNVYISNIAFINNTIINPISDEGDVVPGTLHFLAVKNLRVEGNKIIGANNTVCPAIACYQSTGGQDPAKVQTTDPSISYPVPMRCENVQIRNNEITGYHNAPTVVQVKGSSSSRCFDVEISGNLIYNTNSTAGATNVGPITIDLDYVQRLKFTNNTVRQSRRLVNILNSLDVTISGNIGQAIPTNIITLGNCTRVSVVGNNLIDVPTFGIYAYGTTALAISANTFSCGGAGPAIRVGDAPQFSVMGNALTGFSATKGIEITGASAGIVTGNTVSGFSTPLTPAATTGNVQVGWNSAV